MEGEYALSAGSATAVAVRSWVGDRSPGPVSISVVPRPGGATPTSPRGRDQVAWWWVAGATVAVALLHLWANHRIGHPSVVYDEAGYLGNARWIAGAGAGWEMPWSPRYAVGYPLLIAPLTRLFPDPAAQWRAILVLNAVLLASVLPLLHLVARRVLGAGGRTALLVATVGAVVPTVVAVSVSAIAENLVLPLVPLTVLATWAFGRPGAPAWTRLWFGPCLVALYATHPRFTVVLPLGVVVLAWAAWRRLAPALIVAANGGLLLIGSLASYALSRAVVATRWDHVEALEGGPGDVLRLAGSRSGSAELLWTAVGQAWYQAAGSLGLVVIGVVVVVRTVRTGTPIDTTDDAPDHDDPDVSARRLALVTLLALALAVLVVSVAFFARNQFRADHLVYGRHNDSFTPVWVTAAMVGLIGATRRQVLALVAVATSVTAALFAVLAATRDADAFGGVYSPFAVPALVRSVAGNPSGTYWRATLAAVVGLAVVALVAGLLRRPRWLAPPLAAAAVWSGFGTVHGTDFYEGWWYASWTAPEELARLDIDAISIDGRSADGFTALAYPFHLPDIRFTTYEPVLDETPDQVFVLARLDDEALAATGARIVLLDHGGFHADLGVDGGMALWVQPGPELDELERKGWLLPPGFPTGLPDAARRGTLEIVDAPDRVEVEPGGTVELTVRGRHDGSGSPWPDQASFGLDGRVRVMADIRSLGDDGVEGARSGGELPRWIRPGETFTIDAGVRAVGRYLEPLPPGRYSVTLGIGQDEPRWFVPSPDATFEMRVTG